MAKMRVQARYLQPGDIVGSGEKVTYVGTGIKTPKGKVDVCLDAILTCRIAQWGKYTEINIERPEKVTNG